MRRSVTALLVLIGTLLAVPGHGNAESRTISWAAVTSYTDGTAIEPGKTVSYNLFWTADPGLSPGSLQPIVTSISQTFATFNPDSLGMPRGQTVFLTGEAVVNTGERSSLAPAYAWDVPTLIDLSISGSSSVNENSSAAFTATATWSDGTTTPVAPSWSVDSPYASIGPGGTLATMSVTSDQPLTVTASYTSGGVTKTATMAMTIVYVQQTPVNVPATLVSMSISGPSSVNESGGGTYAATATWSDGTTTSVTPAWSVSPTTYASISAGGVLTTLAVTANQTASVNASYTSGGVTMTATQPVTIVDVPAVLAGLSISGPSSVNESGGGAYAATATWSDGTTTSVSPAWSVSPTTYASISAGGALTTLAVTANQTASVNASYTSGGVTKTATQPVTIVDIPSVPAAPRNMILSGPVQTSPTKLFQLGWDPVTNFMDGTPIGAGNVWYVVYWSSDPGLSQETLRPLGSSTYGTSVTFDPVAEGMARNQRMYFATRATAAPGVPSALSPAITWVAVNEGPAAPSGGRIIKK